MIERPRLSFVGFLGAIATIAGAVACSSPEPSSVAKRNTKGNTSASGGTFADDTTSGDGNASSPGGAASGAVDATPACDTGLAVDDADAASFAKAMGICTTAAKDGYGLVSASYSRAFGSAALPHPGQHGLLPKFGDVIKPREGASIGVLSTGYAREFDDAQGIRLSTPGDCGGSDSCVGTVSDFVNSGPNGPMAGSSYPTAAAPPGFPQSGQSCPQGNSVNDMIDVKLVLKAPMDASGFRFDFDFYSSEWPNFVCSNFNDAFVAYLTSSGMTNNISFDPNKNPIAVNNNYFDRCTTGTPLGCNRTDGDFPDAPIGVSTCAGGAEELSGTGYATVGRTLCSGGGSVATLGGATGWLSTVAPVKPGEQFTLELMIWDAGDGVLDSTVLVDHFQWLGEPPAAPSTTRVN